MCGIVGIWHHGRPDLPTERFRAVVASLAHRGPDGEGTHHDPDVRLHLGHRRLAILDPTPAGAQPMATDDGALVIVHNGEVYDFVERHRGPARGLPAVGRGHAHPAERHVGVRHLGP